ncbi:hypothetical protein, partial [Acaryochloris thomasi]|uniref:hypothetical protein n=1 Tax=Acaryochloris thomasi TaxID=2929456 RepID=UPI001F16070F
RCLIRLIDICLGEKFALLLNLESYLHSELSSISIRMEVEGMSKISLQQLQQLTNDELIDFVLEHEGQEDSVFRRSALQEHLSRSAENPDAVDAPAGDVEILRSKLSRLSSSVSS